ncbi:MAG TPA: histidine kinase [Saprospiraceae bacterium]|nr:histidine kinase [Saprospiraceae bacterium]
MNTDFPLGPAGEIFQDTEGFLWIGTVNGLLRFDGYETRFYTHDPNDSTSIGANNIDAIGQDTQGRIWVGLNGFGLDILNAELKTFLHLCLPDTDRACMQGISVHDVSPEGEHIMWVASTRGLLKFNVGKKPALLQAFRYDPNDSHSLSNDLVLKTFIDSRGRLWIGTNQGINLYDNINIGFINHRSNVTFPTAQTLDITEDREGKIWLSTRFIDECLLIYDEATGNFEAVPEYRNRNLGEFRITFDLDNDLWISARGVGAYHVDAITGERTFFSPKVASNGYRNIYGLQPLTDSYGNVWMTGNHLMKWPSTGKAVKRISSDENQVISVYANDDAIWYSENELWRYQRKTQSTTAILPSHLPTNIRALAIKASPIKRTYCILDYDEDHVIMTTTRNIFIWNTKTDFFKEYPLDFGGPFREFVITPDKKHLWICGNQGMPILFELKTGRTLHPEYVSSILHTRCVVQADNGDLWFGSGSQGVYQLEAATHRVRNFIPNHTDPAFRLSDYTVNDIVISGQYVWVATNLGINRINTTDYSVSNRQLPVPISQESSMSLLVDDSGDIWSGTQRGLIHYNPVTETCRHFDRTDGLINAVYTQGACFKDSHGILYFGGDQGVDYFDPGEMGINAIPPDLYISRILVNNSPADTIIAAHHLSKLSLTHTQNFIEIELLALHLTSPESNTYAYRIPEIDTAWRDLGVHRTITLANMQPGAYTLQARAANADGIWCDDKTMLGIKIKPPFWATIWFIAFCMLAIGALFIFAYRYRIRQIEKRERLKADFNKRIAELESKALRAQMNPHFLFNSINSVKSLISQGHNEKATQYLIRFGQLIRQILANSEKPFVRLQEELEALRLYLEIEQLRFQNFRFKITVGDHVNADFIEVPPLILQPYVENAIWHGLMHQTSGDRRLSVDVTRGRRLLHMTIEDNGIGREKAQQIKMLGNSRKAGMGMRLTGDRLNLLRKIYGQDVSILIEDLFENDRPIGTRVRIAIPCSD